ncbi:MAG: hypothetical protein LBD37_01890 [Treponema sp.]|jgi:hypothetical protein|nr:hypothetical protein [Treponema sp.]
MDFEGLAQARDLWYAAAILAGLSLGCLAGLLPPWNRDVRRNRLITRSLCLFAGALACFGAALSISKGSFLFIKPLLIPGGGIGCIGIAAARFPRGVAFPLFLAMGILTVWTGCSFLRFPAPRPEGTVLAGVYHELNGAYRVLIIEDEKLLKRTAPMCIRESAVLHRDGLGALYIEDAAIPLDISLEALAFDFPYPLVGGLRRGAVTQVRRGEAVLFSKPRPGSPFIPYRLVPQGGGEPHTQAGIGAFRHEIQLSLENIPIGASRLIMFDGSLALVRPSY